MGWTAAAAIVVAVAAGATAVIQADAARSANNQQEDMMKEAAAQAEREAAIAKERQDRELALEKERIEREAAIAREQADWEIKVSEENAKITMGQITKEEQRWISSLEAGYAAAGIESVGSPLAVINSAAAEAEFQRQEVLRGHGTFEEARTKDAELVKEGGEFTYEQFKNRLTKETEYTVQSKYYEAAQARRKGSAYASQNKYAEYGMYAGIAGAMGKGASAYAYGSAGSMPSSARIIG